MSNRTEEDNCPICDCNPCICDDYEDHGEMDEYYPSDSDEYDREES